MHIALIAHDSKKELMVQFSIAYCGILSKHRLCATAGTGKLVSDATGLPVVRFLSGDQGGCEQISSRISCNEVDLLLFFRDPMRATGTQQNQNRSPLFWARTLHRLHKLYRHVVNRFTVQQDLRRNRKVFRNFLKFFGGRNFSIFPSRHRTGRKSEFSTHDVRKSPVRITKSYVISPKYGFHCFIS